MSIDLGGDQVSVRVGSLWIGGAGKAAVAMAQGVAAVVPEARGLVVAPRSSGGGAGIGRVGRIRVLAGDHPVPGSGSFAATRQIVAAIRALPADATVLFLLSGGASALLAAPAPGISRADKQALNAHLLRAGASIEVMNAVRKHVSAVKGGRLAAVAWPRRVVTLALSDVPGDALATIGSGPTVGDPTTFGVSLRRLRSVTPDRETVPARVWRHLEAGARGDGVDESPKPGDRRLARARAAVIGNNRIALDAAAGAAKNLGYDVIRRRVALRGEAAACAVALVAALPARCRRPTCVLGGGETWVRAGAGSGKGARSQELALAASLGLAGTAWGLLCAGTDGVDGRTDAAGAYADGTTVARGGRRRVAQALTRHDAYPFFARLGDLHRPGPSGTNVMDIAIALHPGTGG